MMEQQHSISRIIIEGVKPEIDSGRFPIKRIAGEHVVVEADIFADGYDILSASLLSRKKDNSEWQETPMELLGNDHWRGSFIVSELGCYEYTLTAWVNQFETWRSAFHKKVEAGQSVSVEFLEAAQLIEAASQRATRSTATTMGKWVVTLSSPQVSTSIKTKLALSKKLITAMNKYPYKYFSTTYHHILKVVVDRDKARFSTWYEMFPRSSTSEPGRHGTFKDCESRLGYISKLGFDILYLPPIHPIGKTNRKGKNNATLSQPDDPGTPWAIGSEDGGHKAIHRQLGTLADFHNLVAKANNYGIEIALDIAFQCSPDHPYAKEHPEWFRRRPDGSIQYAENPPKKYQDIYPLDFDTPNWQKLWEELASIIYFWIEQGVRIFRVDNPHTKPFSFWEWLINKVKRDYPEVIFLSEAFTRPRIMYQLAKLGFSQSYTYFTWRNSKWELTQYFTELTQTNLREYFRPNLWPNTPDILHNYLRDGGRPAFITRLVLAATLGANYGIYGPAFELCENHRKDETSEEYLNSEKYEIKYWDINKPNSLKKLISSVNKIRKNNPALQSDYSLHFHGVDNDQLICYSKCTQNLQNRILVIVNLDYRYKQSGWVDLSLGELGLNPEESFRIYDILSDTSYEWHGSRNYVELDPQKITAHVFRLP